RRISIVPIPRIDGNSDRGLSGDYCSLRKYGTPCIYLVHTNGTNKGPLVERNQGLSFDS
ncbi:hypothetical protein K0M31_020034, partial [Melipona bicolor]